MRDRKSLVADFLSDSPWQNWTQAPLAGDASARSYIRLTCGSETVILMDAPPENSEETGPFAEIATFLENHEFAAPRILKHDQEHGLIILSDLGRADFAQWLLATPSDALQLYQSAADVLLKIETLSPPQHLKHMTPDVGAEMVRIVGSHYSKAPTTDLCAQVRHALEDFAPDPNTLALRDFHAENLIWRSEKQGTDRVGLLDFQDAFVAPAGYDLVSMLRDARRDVDAQTAENIITYFEDRTRARPSFRTSLACLGVQRNLRILGVFARLGGTLGKPRYLNLMPRVWGHIQHDLQDPALSQLQQAVMDTVPAPTPKVLAELVQ